MELYISEKIYKYRKDRDMTQEELAAALDVSPQAVSNWERGGYPDITMLPAIANFFGVTIDELLGNDKIGKEADLEKYKQKWREIDDDEERAALSISYYRKYPNEGYYMLDVSMCLSYIIADDPSKSEKYMPLLREVTDKLLDDVYRRNAAICHMIEACDDSELDKWLEMSAYSSAYTRRGNLHQRFMARGDIDSACIQLSLKNLENFSNFIDERFPDQLGPERKAEYHRNMLTILDSLRVDGKLPDGWLLLYGYKSLVLAACLFGCGKADEGWDAFESGMDMMKTWFSFPEDSALELGGGELFGGLKVKKFWHCAVTPDGSEHRLFDLVSMIFFTPGRLYTFLTNPRWAWFDSAREDERFVAAVEWAKEKSNKEE